MHFSTNKLLKSNGLYSTCCRNSKSENHLRCANLLLPLSRLKLTFCRLLKAVMICALILFIVPLSERQKAASWCETAQCLYCRQIKVRWVLRCPLIRRCRRRICWRISDWDRSRMRQIRFFRFDIRREPRHCQEHNKHHAFHNKREYR